MLWIVFSNHGLNIRQRAGIGPLHWYICWKVWKRGKRKKPHILQHISYIGHISGSNEKLNSSSNWFDFVFSILSNFFEDTLYKSTLKSAIIRVMKSVCLHSKQTTGAVWEKINSTRLTSEMKLDFAIRGRSVVICLLLLWLYRLASVNRLGRHISTCWTVFLFYKVSLENGKSSSYFSYALFLKYRNSSLRFFQSIKASR